MEEKEFDKQLSDRIRNVFEGYEDASAEKGWNRLRQKYPAKKDRTVPGWWWTAIAALSFIMLAFWLFWPAADTVNNPKSTRNRHQTEMLKPGENLKDATLPSKKTLPKISAEIVSANKKTIVKKSILTNQMDQSVEKKHPQKSSSKTNNYPSYSTASSRTNLPNADKIKNDPSKQESRNVDFYPLKEAQQSTLPFSTQKQVLVFQPEIKMPVKTASVAKTNSVKKPKQQASKFGFSVYADTHLNFAKGSNNQLGFGGGISSDLKIAPNLKLSAGLALIQNNLFYTSNFPQKNQTNVNNYAVSAPGNPTTTSTQTLNSLDASLLALDVPVNLKYQFYSGKNSMFVSAGLGSTTFVKETYAFNYSNFPASSSQSSSPSSMPQSVKSSKSFDRFDVARTLNLSFGLAYPLGKNQLQIEPFLKYPLSGLGSQQLQFGSVGINLKLNFPTQKK